ncbi:MAG: hypothetical protein NTV02_02955 [Candidatus Zambryskibacteria bacterium]|nr:hypothetical protein [Candidatus Zambryskibacteria bacterium]
MKNTILFHSNDASGKFFIIREGRRLGIRKIHGWSEEEKQSVVVYDALTPLSKWECGSLQTPWALANPKAKYWTGVGWKQGHYPGLGHMGEVVDRLKPSCAPYLPAKVGDILQGTSRLYGQIIVHPRDLERGYCIKKDNTGTFSELVTPVFLIPRISFRNGDVWQACRSEFQL